ncbi:E3 ubiquitin-protein ligase-like protein 2 [Elsinoe fawcettii]|nr:E3 ubiquitin-protein ligase-like protein 2 [Elsinoe fawcettii]
MEFKPQMSKTAFRNDVSVLPISVERTRAIIDFCLTSYLERKLDEKTRESPKIEQSYFPQTTPISVRPGPQTRTSSDDARPRKSFDDYPEVVVESNVTTPDEPPSASIKSFADFDHLTFSSQVKLSSSPLSDSARPAGKIHRKPVPNAPDRKPPPLPGSSSHMPLRHPSGRPSQGSPHPRYQVPITPEQRVPNERYERAKRIFKPLEDFIQQNYGRHESLNASFSTFKPRLTGRTHSESALKTPPPEPMDGSAPPPQLPSPRNDEKFQIDAKTLLLGDFMENGDWWTGRLERNGSERADRAKDRPPPPRRGVTPKSPCVDWARLDRWYETIRTPDRTWLDKAQRIKHAVDGENERSDIDPKLRAEIELDLSIARGHAERALFKITENILRRPGRPLTEPEDIRFLIVIISNPLLYPRHIQERRLYTSRGRPQGIRRPSTSAKQARDPGQHAGILKRSFGLLAGSSEACHRYMVGWFSRMPEGRFLDLVDLVSSFVSYRLSRRKARPKSGNLIDDGGLIPDLSGSAMHTSAQLQTAAGLSGGVKNEKEEVANIDYSDDWQLRAAAKVMALLFAANNAWPKPEGNMSPVDDVALDVRPRSRLHDQLLPVSDFYNTLLDYQDVIGDFKTWEARKGKFSFCQYSFFLSMGSKIRILEYDARRQMETKARETYFNNVISGRAQDVNFHLHVRRECVVEDSLSRIGEAVGQLQGDLKKGLRIHFAGEEGVDAGGLKKEWFLLLVRDIFDPYHGLFLYDSDSQLCYFNPHTFETSDQYYMVGVLLGLAIYNSTILDVALPSFAFRKLLASAPSNPAAVSPITKNTMTYTLDDLAEYRPSLANGLRQLLDYEGDVENTYLWSFTVPVERYGVVTEHPLVPGGEHKPVTNANRHEFVSLYIRYLLDVSVARQFEPFKRGFFTVCAGNALSLFRAEEIELLIRGSEEERIDVDALRAVAVYENFRRPDKPEEVIKTHVEDEVPIVKWFWEYFSDAEPKEQRRLLQFITSSDRVPATGAAGLVLRIAMGGDGTGREGRERYPVARTCFNLIQLWGWESKERLVEMVKGAVEGSEGFGLK